MEATVERLYELAQKLPPRNRLAKMLLKAVAKRDEAG